MRIFGRYRVTKTSTASRTSAVSKAQAAVMPEEAHEPALTELDQTDEMPILRESARLAAVPALPSLPETSARMAPDVLESTTRPGEAVAEDGDSDVFVCRRSSPELSADEMAAAAAAAAANVTLFVYGWENVEPGPLSWVFPSLRAALEAVRTMRNAVEWSICSGADWTDIDTARAKGAVLVEQNA